MAHQVLFRPIDFQKSGDFEFLINWLNAASGEVITIGYLVDREANKSTVVIARKQEIMGTKAIGLRCPEAILLVDTYRHTCSDLGFLYDLQRIARVAAFMSGEDAAGTVH